MENKRKRKTINVSDEIWEKLIKYKIALRHKNLNETLLYLFTRIKKGGK